jgi:hypothetical protein
MNDNPDIVLAGALGADGDDAQTYAPNRGYDNPESDTEANERGPDERALFWSRQIQAALVAERRWRNEATYAEDLYFGPDQDTGDRDPDAGKAGNPISETTSTVHGNIDVLKPLLFSETPTPVVQRRFRGDGKATDETDLMATEVGQRLAQFILSTTRFDDAMEGVRDDWLIPGRGVARAFYKAQFEVVDGIDPMTGAAVSEERKASESVYASRWEWARVVFAPGHSWDRMPWLAFEVPMTRTQIEKSFPEMADRIAYNNKGMIDRSRAFGDDDRASPENVTDTLSSGEPVKSPFDTATVWEIWNKETRQVIWWSPDCRGDILGVEADPLNLEEFWPMPKPLLATTKGESLIPRPDVRYYEAAAEEVEEATKKMREILKVLAVSGVFPGQMRDAVEKLLSGKNAVYPVESWIGLIDKGGTRDMIQWLPIDAMVAALQALQMLREAAKQRMFEASGVSDIMRAQGDPRESATAQNLKGKYAGMRLSSKQRRMAIYVRDMLRILVEIAVEMFDTAYLAEICNIDLPLSEAERQQMQAQQEAQKQQFGMVMQQYQAMQQQRQMVEQAAQQQGGALQLPPMPPPPQEPKFDRIPATSWELVHNRLRNDLSRKITITIETQSTILADETEDKQARIEFLGAFSGFVQQILPLVGTGQFDMRTAKELLLFGVRAFPKSRTLESMISELPDEMPPGQDKEDTQVQVAKIRAEVDLKIEAMRQEGKKAELAQDMKMKGADLIAEAAHKAGEVHAPPQQQQ